jgi:hypothetical protein
LALVLGVAALVAGAWLHEREPRDGHGAGAVASAPPGAGASAGSVPAAARSVHAVAAAGSRAVPAMVLPPQNVPLASYLPALAQAARRGEVAAMCRLSFELARCTSDARWQRSYFEEASDRVLYDERPAPDYALKEYERAKEQLAETERICAGVVPPADLRPWRLLRDAARAGHVPSMVRFGTGFPSQPNGSLDDMDALRAWRYESIGFLETAARAGDAWAAYSMFWGYSGNSGFPTHYRKNPRLALAFAIALRGIGSPETRDNVTKGETKLRRKLSPAEIADAERIAAGYAPGFAHLAGAPVDLRGRRDEAAEDCAWPDPRKRPLPVVEPGPTAPGTRG